MFAIVCSPVWTLSSRTLPRQASVMKESQEEEPHCYKKKRKKVKKRIKKNLTWCRPTQGSDRSESRGTLTQTCRRPTGSRGTAGPPGGSTAAPEMKSPRCSCWRCSPTMSCTGGERGELGERVRMKAASQFRCEWSSGGRTELFTGEVSSLSLKSCPWARHFCYLAQSQWAHG